MSSRRPDGTSQEERLNIPKALIPTRPTGPLAFNETHSIPTRHEELVDILVNNAGLMLLGPIVGADPEDWDRMIAVNVQALLHTTHAALPHLLKAAADSTRRVADIVNISSIAGRVSWNGYGVYNLTKFGVNGFTESLRQEITQRHVRVGVLEPGGVDTELGSHYTAEVRGEMIDPFYEQTEVLAPEDIADGVAYMVTRPRHASIAELWIMPTDQA